MSVADGRQLCILYSSCIADGLKYFLRESDEFRRRYLLKPYIFYQVSEIIDVPEEDRNACDVLIYHNSEWISYPEPLLDQYEALLDSFPNLQRRIRYPLVQFHPLWPFHADEPRNRDADRPRNRWGGLPFYEYGDSYVLRLLQEGMPGDEIVARYLGADVSEIVDLDRLLAGTLARLERNEQHSDVKLVDFVAENFRLRKLFSTVNHINNRALLHLANQVLALLDCPPLPDATPDRFRILISTVNPFEMPVHPSIARHYGVEYLDDRSRYTISRFRNLTFAEYINDYVHFL